jgi:hypothetical protein
MKTDSNDFCNQLNMEWSLRYAKIPSIIEGAKNKKNVKAQLEDLELAVDDNLSGESIDVTKENYPILLYEGEKNNSSSNSTITPTVSPNLSLSPSQKSASNNPLKKFDFVRMRDYIKNTYIHKDFKWEKMVIKNNCVTPANANTNANANANANAITLNPTQKFITHYFTPSSPFKGLLLWHSVGTGKTCTGIATATSSFDNEDYTILWVTRTTLKEDIWKNIFDQVCHQKLRKYILKGNKIPDDRIERFRLLSKYWRSILQFNDRRISINLI